MNAFPLLLEKMVAEWQIRDVIARYARGVDRRDGALIRQCFHAGAPTHYGDFDGTVDTFVPWVLDYVATYKCTMHFMGSVVVDWPKDQAGNRAIAETYAAVLHETGGDKPRSSWVAGIRYIDRFERRAAADGVGDMWLIAERSVAGDWLRIDPAANHRRFGDVMPTGKRGPDDPLYAMLSGLDAR